MKFNLFDRKSSQTLSIADIVDTVFRNHPPECIFADGARERIIATGIRSCSGRYEEWRVIDALEKAFKAEEIYCPREGIDRRSEFGLIPPDPGFCCYMGGV